MPLRTAQTTRFQNLPAKKTSWVPAILLAGITLAVFTSLQNYGPQSAVRRFHQAIVTRDRAALETSVLEPVDSKPVGMLLQGVERLLLNGPPALTGSRQMNRSEQLLLTYRDGFGNAFPIVFFVEKPERQKNWKINASKTSVAFENYLRAFYGLP